MGKRVLLTNIGGSTQGAKPTAISILSAVLKEKGHEVALFDTTYMDLGFKLDGEISDEMLMFRPVNWEKYGLVRDKKINAQEEFLRVLNHFKPDVIAASCYSDMYQHTIQFMDLAKRYSDIPVIVGGIHSTLLPQEVAEAKSVDALCVGEGEYALLEYLDALDHNNNITRTDIKNLWIKKDGEIHKNDTRPLIDPNELPFMDYSLYDDRHFLRPFQGKIIRSGDYQDKRGCPRKCTYCAYATLNTEIYSGGRVKYYTAERFSEEAKYLKDTYNLEFFKIFSEDIFVRPLDDFAKMSELYAKKVNLPFTTTGHPMVVTPKKAELLRKMNCVSVSIALESGNQAYRESHLERRYTNEQFGKAIKILQDAGIRVASLNMVGMPDETREMIFETIETNRKYKPDHANFGCFFPFRHTPLGDMAVDKGYSSVKQIQDSRFQGGYSILNQPQLTASEVDGIMKMHYFYYSYPKFMWPLFKFCEKKGPLQDGVHFLLKLFHRICYETKFQIKTLKALFRKWKSKSEGLTFMMPVKDSDLHSENC